MFPTIFLLTAYFLFLFQLLTEFVAAIYAFGLLGTSIPPEMGMVVLLLSPLALLIWRKLPRRLLLALLLFMAFARLITPWLPTRGVLWAAGLGSAAALLALPLLLRRTPPDAAEMGLATAVALLTFFRALGSGVDVSLDGSWLNTFVWWLAILSNVAWKWRDIAAELVNEPPQHTTTPEKGALLLDALGIASVLFLLSAAFVAPAVLARWADWQPIWAYGIEAMALAAFGASLFRRRALPTRRDLTIMLAVFTLLLGGGIARLQTHFPADLSAYPLLRPQAGFPWELMLAVLFFPLLFTAFGYLHHDLRARRADTRALGAAFAAASLYLLALILAHVSTTTYDYIPVIGPLFRNRFWLVYAVPGAVLALAVARSQATALSLNIPRPGQLAAGLIVTALLAPLSAAALGPHPPRHLPAADMLKVVTYNIQQGYRADGNKGWHDQVALLASLQPDIIGLEESDTARLSGANNDLVGYFAATLHMHAYYGPPTVDGTFGIALLSRYPITAARTVYLYSRGEQTAAIVATVAVGKKALTVVVTHLGNGGPLVQQDNLLEAIAGRRPLVLMGDFNFTPGTPQYRLTVQTLRDACPAPPADAIDHIFLTPDLTATQCRYIASPASDHPAVEAETQGQ